METIKLNYEDRLIIDPCYIKSVKCHGDLRFDALKLVKVHHDGRDGDIKVEVDGVTHWLGVDSGRIWELQAEFDCEVEVDSGLSGHIIARKGEAK